MFFTPFSSYSTHCTVVRIICQHLYEILVTQNLLLSIRMDFTAFSHGQITSKLWLCEHLEPHLPDNARVAILGCWYNVLGFMLLTRKPKAYQCIKGYDISSKAINIANKVCDAWMINTHIVSHEKINVNKLSYDDVDVIINCSPEHMTSIRWFDQIPNNKLVCIQSISIDDPKAPWFIKTPTPTMSDFKKKYALSNTKFCDMIEIRYVSGWGYDRYMTIGYK